MPGQHIITADDIKHHFFNLDNLNELINATGNVLSLRAKLMLVANFNIKDPVTDLPEVTDQNATTVCPDIREQLATGWFSKQQVIDLIAQLESIVYSGTKIKANCPPQAASLLADLKTAQADLHMQIRGHSFGHKFQHQVENNLKQASKLYEFARKQGEPHAILHHAQQNYTAYWPKTRETVATALITVTNNPQASDAEQQQAETLLHSMYQNECGKIRGYTPRALTATKVIVDICQYRNEEIPADILTKRQSKINELSEKTEQQNDDIALNNFAN